jgi:ribosomal protein L37AE/L43A
MTETDTSVLLSTCGPALQAVNPEYDTPFQEIFRTYVQKTWDGATPATECTSECLQNNTTRSMLSDALATTAGTAVVDCASCLKNARRDASKAAWGCRFCVEILAPRAYITAREILEAANPGTATTTTPPAAVVVTPPRTSAAVTLPSVGQIRSFLDETQLATRQRARTLFQALPMCEREAWVSALCGNPTQASAAPVPYLMPVTMREGEGGEVGLSPDITLIGILMVEIIIILGWLYVYRPARPDGVDARIADYESRIALPDTRTAEAYLGLYWNRLVQLMTQEKSRAAST